MAVSTAMIEDGLVTFVVKKAASRLHVWKQRYFTYGSLFLYLKKDQLCRRHMRMNAVGVLAAIQGIHIVIEMVMGTPVSHNGNNRGLMVLALIETV